MPKLQKFENKVFSIDFDQVELLYCMQAINWALSEIMPEKTVNDSESNGFCTTLIILNHKLTKHLDSLIEDIQSE